MIYVLKNPNPQTRAIVYNEPTEGAEAMTEAEFIAWRDAQPEIALPPPPYRVSKDTIWNRIKAMIGLPAAAAYIAALPTEERIDWDANAWFWSDNQPIRAKLAAAGFTPEQIDAIFAPEQ